MEQDSKFQANTSLENNSQGKVPFISKLAYGMGDVGCNFSWMFVGNFLMIFYTDVFGISMSAVATLMLVSRFWDAINDPIIGTLTDKTHTRWGRFRPWHALRSSYHGTGTDTHLLGSSGMEPDRQDYLYGSNLLHPGAGIYLREPALRHTLRSHDARHR